MLLMRCSEKAMAPHSSTLPGKSHGQRSLVGCSAWGLEESDTTEQLHFHFLFSCIGEGNGNPLQCSCLENPRDREPGGLPSMESQQQQQWGLSCKFSRILLDFSMHLTWTTILFEILLTHVILSILFLLISQFLHFVSRNTIIYHSGIPSPYSLCGVSRWANWFP